MGKVREIPFFLSLSLPLSLSPFSFLFFQMTKFMRQVLLLHPINNCNPTMSLLCPFSHFKIHYPSALQLNISSSSPEDPFFHLVNSLLPC